MKNSYDRACGSIRVSYNAIEFIHGDPKWEVVRGSGLIKD